MRNLISKVYFPRMIVPASSVITSFVDFLVSFLILVGMMAWYRFWPDWRILTLPLFMALAFLAAIGPGLLITALNVKYRDFRYVIPFLVQFGLYVSPGGLQQRGHPPSIRRRGLHPLLAQSDGGRDRRLPLGDPGRRGNASTGPASSSPWLSCSLFLLAWHPLLSQDREDLRGHNIGVR